MVVLAVVVVAAAAFRDSDKKNVRGALWAPRAAAAAAAAAAAQPPPSPHYALINHGLEHISFLMLQIWCKIYWNTSMRMEEENITMLFIGLKIVGIKQLVLPFLLLLLLPFSIWKLWCLLVWLYLKWSMFFVLFS